MAMMDLLGLCSYGERLLCCTLQYLMIPWGIA
jgi:hypothetical protein